MPEISTLTMLVKRGHFDDLLSTAGVGKCEGQKVIFKRNISASLVFIQAESCELLKLGKLNFEKATESFSLKNRT